MKTFEFLVTNLADEASIIVLDVHGEIPYKGVLSQLPYSLIKKTVVTGIDLDHNGYIVIGIAPQ